MFQSGLSLCLPEDTKLEASTATITIKFIYEYLYISQVRQVEIPATCLPDSQRLQMPQLENKGTPSKFTQPTQPYMHY